MKSHRAVHAPVWQHTNRLDLALVGRPPFGILSSEELSILNRGHTGTAVHEAGGSQGSAPWVKLPHPQKAVAPGPRRLGATAEEAQPGATRPEREHVRRWVSSTERVDLANDDDLEPTLVLPATAPVLPRMGPGVLIPTSKLASEPSREAGSWRAPLSGRRSTSWRCASSRPPKRADGTS